MDPRTRRGFKMKYFVGAVFFLGLAIDALADFVLSIKKADTKKVGRFIDAMFVAACTMSVVYCMKMYFTGT